MKVAVLGAQGFVGSNLSKYLSNFHEVVPVSRGTLDMLDPYSVRAFLEQQNFDVIVNCAAVMTDNNTLHDARNNLGIFMNFYNCADLFEKFINTASGAEFDRRNNIENANESEIFNCMPLDSYGWGQNIKARLCAQTDNFYNIRIFNCFGRGERSTRIFSRFLAQGHLEISDDRYFDYFSIQDLGKVVSHCIANNWAVRDINAVYEHKYKISEVIDQFCTVNNLKSKFKVISKSSNNYTGSGLQLKQLGIELEGLAQGLQAYTQED